MPNVEIDETELANLRRVAQIADVVGKHPKARGLLQQAVAIAAPDQVGPETRLRQEIDEKFEALTKELRADREARDKAAAEQVEKDRLRQLENQWATTRSEARKQGYTDEGLTQLETWMEKRGVADHTIAIPAFERENPPPPPVLTGGQSWNFFDQKTREDVDLKPLFDGNEDAFMNKAIAAALNDVRNQR
jgi:hypothetical protein